MSAYPIVSGLEICGPMNPGYAEILTPEACAFLAGLFEKFGPRRLELLAKRVAGNCGHPRRRLESRAHSA
jgi:malate synthase